MPINQSTECIVGENFIDGLIGLMPGQKILVLYWFENVYQPLSPLLFKWLTMPIITSIVAITFVNAEESGHIRQPTIIFNIHKGCLWWQFILQAEYTMGPVEETVDGTENIKERTVWPFAISLIRENNDLTK